MQVIACTCTEHFWQPIIGINQIVFEKLSQKFLAHIWTLLSLHFLPNWSKIQGTMGLWSILEVTKLLPIERKMFFDFRILLNVSCLTTPQLIDQFWCNMCRKKCKDLDYKLLEECFKNNLLYTNGWLSKKLFSTYVCYDRECLFWLPLHNIFNWWRFILVEFIDFNCLSFFQYFVHQEEELRPLLFVLILNMKRIYI